MTIINSKLKILDMKLNIIDKNNFNIYKIFKVNKYI